MKKLVLGILVVAPCITICIAAASLLLANSKPKSHSLPKFKNQAALLPKKLPRAVADETTFVFGEMDPLTMGTHTFLIKNTGSAPLTLHLGETSCKCTFGKLKNSSVAPGETGEITLSWNTGSKKTAYSNGARVHTNDPRNRAIVFRVEGLVRRKLGFEPPEFVFSRVEPDSQPAAETNVFSQIWDGFEIEDVKSTLPGLRWETFDLRPDEIEQQKAKSGKRLQVTLPNDIPIGFFQHRLTVFIRADGEQEVQSFQIPLMGKVLRRLSAYSGKIDAHGVITLGAFKAGTKQTCTVLLKVRDQQRILDIKDIEVNPAFIKVKVEPSPGLKKKGLYRMTVEIPGDAPVGSYTGVRQASIGLRVEHPRIEGLDLKLNFLVLKD